MQGRKTIDTIGGTTETKKGLDRDEWDAWAGSVDEKPGFLGFAKDNGLVPIWDLAPPERGEEIRQAYWKKAAKQLTTHILSVTSALHAHPEARVKVPDGYKLVGGGAKDDWTGAGNLLTSSFPESNNTWMASGKDHRQSGAGTITAYAIALYDPDDIWETKIFHSTSPSEEHHPMKETAVEPGYVMVGGGARVHWRGRGNLLLASYPKDKTTWRAHSKDHVEPSPATITTYAIGLRLNPNKVTGLQVETDKIEPPSKL